MIPWIRRRPRSFLEEKTALWHLEGMASSAGAPRQAWASCGSALGLEVDEFPKPDVPDSGDRCPSCQATYMRQLREA